MPTSAFSFCCDGSPPGADWIPLDAAGAGGYHKRMETQTWTPLPLIKTTMNFFASKGVPSPRLDAEILLCHVLGCDSRMQLFTSFERALGEAELARYRELVRRRARREPVSYILGVREFMGITFKVTPAVLTPRPETEILVENVIRRLTGPKQKRSAAVFKQIDLGTLRATQSETPSTEAVNAALDAYAQPHPDDKETTEAIGGASVSTTDHTTDWVAEAGATLPTSKAGDATNGAGEATPNNAEARVLDIGTGSGCIAVSIAAHAPQAKLVATDISDDALAVARENATRAKVSARIDFRAGDVFAPLHEGETFDYILANPPYVATGDTEVWREVADYEPPGAVYADDDGLAIIHRIVDGVEARLNPGGVLMIEIGAGQAERVKAYLAAQTTLDEIHTLDDYEGIARVVVATKKIRPLD